MDFEKQEPFVQRMIEEQKDLQEKLEKVNAFIGSEKYAKLDEYNRSLLYLQREAMAVYFEKLTARISLNVK